MECPNGCRELSTAKGRDLIFDDAQGNSIMLTIEVEWCPDCMYIGMADADQ